MSGNQKELTEQINKIQPDFKEILSACLKNRPKDHIEFIIEQCKGKISNKDSESDGKDVIELRQKVAFLQNKIKQLEETRDNEDEELNISGFQDEQESDEEYDEVDDLPSATTQKKYRYSVTAEASHGGGKPQAEVDKKSEAQTKVLMDLLKNSFIFKTVDSEDFDKVVAAMKKRVVSEGQSVIKQGDDGDEMFIVEKGALNCSKNVEDGSELPLRVYNEGESFGELALLQNVPRAANIKAASDCVLWEINRSTFTYQVKESSIHRRTELISFLGTVSILSELTEDEKEKLADCFTKENYSDDDKIINQGDAGEKFQIVKEGEAQAIKEGQKKLMDYKKGDYFGELALLRNEPRAASVKARGTCIVLSLDRRAFKRLLGPLENILKRNMDKYNMHVQD